MDTWSYDSEHLTTVKSEDIDCFFLDSVVDDAVNIKQESGTDDYIRMHHSFLPPSRSSVAISEIPLRKSVNFGSRQVRAESLRKPGAVEAFNASPAGNNSRSWRNGHNRGETFVTPRHDVLSALTLPHPAPSESRSSQTSSTSSEECSVVNGDIGAGHCWMSMICTDVPSPSALHGSLYSNDHIDMDVSEPFPEIPDAPPAALPHSQQSAPVSSARAEDMRLLADMFRRISGVFVTNPVTKTNDFISLDQKTQQREYAVQTDVSGQDAIASASVANMESQTDHAGVVSLEPGWGIHLVVVQRVNGPPVAPIVLPLQTSGDHGQLTNSAGSIVAMAASSGGLTSFNERSVAEASLEKQLETERKLRLRAEQQLAECRKECELLKSQLQSSQVNRSQLLHGTEKFSKAYLSFASKYEGVHRQLMIRRVFDTERHHDESSQPFAISAKSGKRSPLAGDSDNSEADEKLDKLSQIGSCSSRSGSVVSEKAVKTRVSTLLIAAGVKENTESEVNNSSEHVCQKCGRACETAGALRHHNRRVHTPEAKLLFCQYCNVSKKRRDHLILHETKCQKNPKVVKSGLVSNSHLSLGTERDTSSASSGY
ncbi:LOW QUALITY PROTEIN: uncharacterized protein LOC129591605 [Paramacrobiotus metropolitanus]|uniref:LOW QUALITY PROTEIN: uncharacterized protein LOC129591605 n=1 Tax=Paramacrobiotus metropolitanus TaxID=2943436 RepID=UPI0024463C7B|nr:LOW QUALITY PROTEIN: uncharacterized protein LOC129591605 [Paramacrobiotus metropolitanus]